MAKTLGEFEQLVLFALLYLGEGNAYGVTIREAIEERTGRTVSSGAVYTALDRLEDQQLVASWSSEPTTERGGRRKRLFRLEPLGLKALEKSVRTFQNMSEGLIPLIGQRLAATGSEEEGV